MLEDHYWYCTRAEEPETFRSIVVSGSVKAPHPQKTSDGLDGKQVDHPMAAPRRDSADLLPTKSRSSGNPSPVFAESANTLMPGLTD
jgi:hypothetical protein